MADYCTIYDGELLDCGLTKSQRDGFEKLRFFFELHERRVRTVAGISTRPDPLIVGPSGSGKTFLVTKLAADQSLPMFAVNAQNWIPLGARSESAHTLTQILRFIEMHPRGIVFVDEVNKLTVQHTSDSSWCADVLSEILAFLDMDVRLKPAGFSADQTDHLWENFFIVGGGAFQGEWHGSRSREIGFFEFSAEQKVEKYRRAVQTQTQVADELLFRFNTEVIAIEPPTGAEFAERIETVRRALRIPALDEKRLSAVVAEAVESNRMMRWLEGYVVRCMSDCSDGIDRGASLLENLGVCLAPTLDFVPITSGASQTATTKRRAFCAAYEIYARALRDLESAAVSAEFGLADLLRVASQREEMQNDRTLLCALNDARKIFRDYLAKPDASLVGWMRWLAGHVGQVAVAKSDEDRCEIAKKIDVVSEGLKRGIVRLRGCIDGADVASSVRPALVEYIVAAQRLSATWQTLARLVVDQD